MSDAVELHSLRAAGPRRLAERPPGTGVYTGMRTFEHDRLLWLDAHFERLEANIATLGWDYTLDRDVVRRGLHTVLAAHASEDARIRLDVLAEGPRDERVICELRPFVPVPPRYLEEGVGIALTTELRRVQPRVKNTAFIEERRPYPLQDQACFEHVMVDEDGRLLEGTSSNFFGVVDGALLTRGDDVLEGITRRIFMTLCDRAGIAVDLAGLRVEDLARLDEAFITSSSRGLVPVCSIEGRPVAGGTPGPVARRLMSDYDALARAEARPAIEA